MLKIRNIVDEERDAKIEEALLAARAAPEIQKQLQTEITELKEMSKNLSDRLAEMEIATKRRECNKIRDRLLQNYRYYTNKGSWTEMESDAFWSLFGEYEENGGDGFMHSVVQPAMELLEKI